MAAAAASATSAEFMCVFIASQIWVRAFCSVAILTLSSEKVK